MKRAVVTAAVLLLLLCFTPAAHADVIYPDPTPLEVGETLDHLAASVEPGSRVGVTAGSLPPGVSIATEERGDALYVYLRGVPEEAGNFDVILSVNEQSSYLFSISVRPAEPMLIVGPSVVCHVNDTAQLSVTASVADGGQLSYQWYASPGGTGSSLIVGADEPMYQPGTAYAGVTYYYCVVTNTNNGLTATAATPMVSVTVKDRSIVGLSVESRPTKTVYSVGDTLDTAGLTLRVSYSDGSGETVSAGYQLYPTLLDSAGLQTVEVSYEGWICSFQVEVREEEVVEGIGVLTLPTRTVYTVGESLDPAGLSIRAYTNHGYRDVSEGLRINPVRFTEEGSQSVTVYYQGKTCSFSVLVEAEEQPGYLALYRLPDKLSYTVGETLDTAGLVLQLISTKNNAMEVREGYSVYPVRLDTPGRQEITVSYGGFSCSFSVNVTESPAAPSSSPVPTSAPTAAPASAPTAAPAESPAAPLPTEAPSSPVITAQPVRSVGSGRSFVGVIVGASVLALSVLGAYVYIMNRGGFDRLDEMLERLFRRRK